MDANILEKLLDSDQEFDVDEWDVKMSQTFNEDYYKVRDGLHSGRHCVVHKQEDDTKFPLTKEEKQMETQSTDPDPV